MLLNKDQIGDVVKRFSHPFHDHVSAVITPYQGPHMEPYQSGSTRRNGIYRLHNETLNVQIRKDSNVASISRSIDHMVSNKDKTDKKHCETNQRTCDEAQAAVTRDFSRELERDLSI